MSFPVNEIDPVIKRIASNDQALESEAEEDVIHVEPLSRTASRITGGGYDPPTEDLGLHGGNTDSEGGIISEQGYGAPILASDEVAKTPGMEWLTPAVPPEQERWGNQYFAGVDSDGNPVYQSGHRNSRPSSRSNSLSGLHRFTSQEEGSHTPLEDVKEYEPLFPDDDGVLKTKDGRIPGKTKRPDYLARHHFPSKDVWEDTPSSLMYVTTVETPPPDDTKKEATKTFEPPEAEQARKEDITEEDQEDFLSEHTKKFAKPWLNKDAQADMPERPGMERRFPSQDIWEDSPSHSLITTVITPQPESKETSPQEAKKQPEIPARPAKAQPPVPVRPAKTRDAKEISPVDKKAPTIPERPKPQVPTRPSKPLTRDSAEQVPLAKTTSIGSTGSANEALADGVAVVEKKAPPPRPAKQFGGIKGGFISELQNKLQLGPQAPKKEAPPPEEEKVEEKAPLADARKGRARGPARRKPGVSPSAAATVATEEAPKKVAFSIAQPWSVWEIGDDAALEVGKVVNAAKELLVDPTAMRQPSSESITPPLQDGGSSEAPGEGYFAAASPATSTKAAAKAAPAVQSPEEKSKPSEDVAAEPLEKKDESLAEMHSEESAPAKPTQTGETVIEHGTECQEKEDEKVTAHNDTHASESGDVVVKGGEEVPSLTATAGEEAN